MPGEYDRYNMRREVSLTANVVGEDLGTVAGQVSHAIARSGELPRGAKVEIRGQVAADARRCWRGWGWGSGWPWCSSSCSWQPTFSRSGSPRRALDSSRRDRRRDVDVVCDADDAEHPVVDRLDHGDGRRHGERHPTGDVCRESPPRKANRPRMRPSMAAKSRLRAVLMTSFAMMAGMLPMAIALGESGQHNAPLGRAVLGGLAAATLATLLILALCLRPASEPGRSAVRLVRSR